MITEVKAEWQKISATAYELHQQAYDLDKQARAMRCPATRFSGEQCALDVGHGDDHRVFDDGWQAPAES